MWYCDGICALISGLPPNRSFESETETVWPSLVEDYEQVSICTDASRDLPTNSTQSTGRPPDASISSLFGPEFAHPFEPPCSMQALRCKSLAVLMRVSKFTAICTTSKQRSTQYMRFESCSWSPYFLGFMRTPEFRKQFQV